MTEARRQVGRREFLVRMTRGAVGLAVFGIAAACGDDDDIAATTAAGAGTTGAPVTTAEAGATTAPAAAATTSTSAPQAGSGSTIERVSLGFVSAYIVERDGAAAVVDTGVSGSAGDIEAGLAVLGLDWTSVGSVIFTHNHGDHVGSARDVMEAAGGAEAFAGDDDIARIDSSRPITAVGDGDTVFGLDVIATPGHTPGHIAVLDPIGRFLVAGDALNGLPDGSGVAGPNPEFSSDMTTAIASAIKLGGFEYDDAYFGHGEPFLGGAAAAVAAMAATLEA
jgi:glyoxylase-like metal-dependent hydrolase (beta-lactamase superfamily II)